MGLNGQREPMECVEDLPSKQYDMDNMICFPNNMKSTAQHGRRGSDRLESWGTQRQVELGL